MAAMPNAEALKPAQETSARSRAATAESEPHLDDIKAEAKGVAEDFVGAAKDQSRQLLDAARGQASDYAEQRREDVASSVSQFAKSLRGSADSFDGRPALGLFLGNTADGLEQIAGHISDRSVTELYRDVETFARRQPVVVGAVALAAGFAFSRFLKSSSESGRTSDLTAERVGRAAQHV